MTPEVAALIGSVEKGTFRPDNKAEVAILQSMIDSGVVWQLSAPWHRFVKTMETLGYVTLG